MVYMIIQHLQGRCRMSTFSTPGFLVNTRSFWARKVKELEMDFRPVEFFLTITATERTLNSFLPRFFIDIDLDPFFSHVAGIIGGRTSGVAKGANLIAVKVMDAKGLGSVEEVLRGLQFVQVQAQNTRRLGRKCVIK